MSIDLLERPVTTNHDSIDRFSHIVVEGWWPKDETGERTGEFIPDTPVIDGVVFGTPVKALCGKIWIPGEDIKKYQVCPTCIEIAKENGWPIPKI